MSNQIKLIRGQIRQIILELLPEMLQLEFYKAVEKRVNLRLDQIEKQTKATMHEMNENHKNTMGYLVRQATIVSPDKK